MARMRTLKPGFFTSLDIAELRRETRLHFAGLWTYADDYGRGVDDPRLIKAAVWPLDDDITIDDIERMQDELAKHDRITRFMVAGRPFFQVHKWLDHQKPNRRVDTALPAVEDADIVKQCGRSADAVQEQCSSGGEGSGEVGGEGTPPSTDVDTQDDDSFEHFWDAWPRRNGKKLARDKAERIWSRLTLPERRAAYIGAQHYAAASDAGLAGAKDAFRWLRDREWPDWQTPAQPRDGPSKAAQIAATYGAAADEAERMGQ